MVHKMKCEFCSFEKWMTWYKFLVNRTFNKGPSYTAKTIKSSKKAKRILEKVTTFDWQVEQALIS